MTTELRDTNLCDLIQRFGPKIETSGRVKSLADGTAVQVFHNEEEVALHFPGVEDTEGHQELHKKFAEAAPEAEIMAFIAGNTSGIHMSAEDYNTHFALG